MFDPNLSGYMKYIANKHKNVVDNYPNYVFDAL